MQVNPGSIQLTTTSPLIKNIFKPGSSVKAYVNKVEGENVINSVSNNPFKVKSQVNLQEGTWIKGKVFLDKNGTINLKLLETLNPKDSLQIKAEEFVNKNMLDKLPNSAALTRALLENNITPTRELIERLAPISKNLSGGQLKTISWLLSQNLQASAQNINGAGKYLEGDFKLPLFYSAGENLILNTLTLNPSNTTAITEKDGFIDFPNLKGIFDLFLKGDNASKTLDEFVNFLQNNNQGMEIMDVFNLFQKLNIKNSLQNTPYFWGLFFFDFSGDLKPVEFFLNKRYIKRHNKNSREKSYAGAYNIGLYLTPPVLGPIIIRLFYTSPILALKFSVNYNNTYNLIQNNTALLKQKVGLKKFQLSKIDIEKTG